MQKPCKNKESPERESYFQGKVSLWGIIHPIFPWRKILPQKMFRVPTTEIFPLWPPFFSEKKRVPHWSRAVYIFFSPVLGMFAHATEACVRRSCTDVIHFSGGISCEQSFGCPAHAILPRGPSETSGCRGVKIAAGQFLPLSCRSITLTTRVF